MAIKSLDLSARREVVSKYDPACDEAKSAAQMEQNGATVFVLGMLDNRLKAHFDDALSEYSIPTAKRERGVEQAPTLTKASVHMNVGAIEKVQFALRETRNLQDAGGDAIRWKTKKLNRYGGDYEVADDAVVAAIPMDVILELAGVIEEMNDVTRADEKNSGASSPRPSSSPGIAVTDANPNSSAGATQF